VFSYTNRRGVTYYVHESRTKTGARRYLVKRSARGALAECPAGMEIVESVNARVSIRKVRQRIILTLEEEQVRQALEKHGREEYRVEAKGRDLIVHEPDYDVEEIAELMDPLAAWGPLAQELDRTMRRQMGAAACEKHRQQKRQRVRRHLQRTMRYSPVLRFRLEDPTQRLFAVERMSYRGHGGWLPLTAGQALAAACDRYVPLLGTDELFEEF
jgi:hypothetical protein